MNPFSLLTAAPALFAPPAADVAPDAVLLRFPDVSADSIVFTYADDLWIVEKTGGVARRLTTSPGTELFAKFSPDGTRLAFTGGYEGGRDLYTMTVAAGEPDRVTHHPAGEVLCDWTPDGERLIYFSTEVSFTFRAARLLTVAAGGGQPEPLPVPYGVFGAIDASGSWLAYTPTQREGRTWKRYQGGMAQDVWLFQMQTHESRCITDHPGTDSLPMWHDGRVVFLSDRGPVARMNLWSYDLGSGEFQQLTDFRQVDVRFPSMGPDDVVFEAGGELYRYEFATGKRVQVDVKIPGERPDLGRRRLDVEENLAGAHPGPTGKRVVVEARGEVFDVPVEEGVTRNLTRSDGVAERDPTWSPDSEWVAYFSDRSGEYELTLRRVDGASFDGADENRERRLTDVGPGWKSDPTWSPDSKKLAFSTNDGALHVVVVASGELRTLATNPEGEPLDVDWSPDSNWLAFSHRHPDSRLSAIHLLDVTTGTDHVVTAGKFEDSNPVFDRDGDWLYYRTLRAFEPEYEDWGTTWIYTNGFRIAAVPLRADVENPWAPEDEAEESALKEDEEEAEEGAKGEGDAAAPAGGAETADAAAAESSAVGEEDDEDEEEEAFRIELDGLEARALLLPIEAGEIGNLEGAASKVLYVRSPRTGTEGGEPKLCYFDMKEEDEEKAEKTVLSDLGGYLVDAAGEHVLVFRNRTLGMVALDADQEFEAIDLDGMTSVVDPRAEWRQILDDVYRLYRDFFYDEGMHGVDWKGVHQRYVDALPDACSRADIHLFIAEMISELNVGHAYNSAPTGGLGDEEPGRPVGLLGCDWELVDGAYRIAKILCSNAPYDLDARSPLSAQGVDVEAGDWLLEVDGVPVDPTVDVYAAFEGTVGRVTELTVNAQPRLDGDERKVLVEPIASDAELRYRDWVAANRAHVEARSGGRIGYVHVPDTGVRGQTELYRQLLGEMDKDALIVDERFNSGGQIPTRFIELLNRPITNYWAIRHGEDWVWPPEGHRGPKAMLINGWSGSGGDCFPYYFRQAGLGKLIGRRTWGGLVGISGNPALIDGARPTVPRFAFYELDGTWGVEGYGVPPDIDVVDDPAVMVDGTDPQLEAAIEELTRELATYPFQERRRPPSPDRSGAGIPDADR